MIALGLFSLLSLQMSSKYDIDLVRLEDLIPEEVASKASIEIEIQPDLTKWKNCIPRESRTYSKAALEAQAKDIFQDKEEKDFNACTSSHCAFNFLASEVVELEKAKGDKKNLIFKFVENRVKGNAGLDPKKSPQFIRSKEKVWERCGENSEIATLLDSRPAKKAGEFRFSVVKYKSNMRPTLRLLQGKYFEVGDKKDSTTLCFAEAVDFATHYDIDRVEVWSWEHLKNGSRLGLQIRHRVDLLNTWARRLSKPQFVKQHEQILTNQISEAAACLEGKK